MQDVAKQLASKTALSSFLKISYLTRARFVLVMLYRSSVE